METNRKPRPGEIYRHFKNKLYQIITVAIHTETGEELVVYQALYGDFKSYVRPLSMFCSKVDKNKYPKVSQKYRFQLITDKFFQEDLAVDEEQTETLQREDVISKSNSISNEKAIINPNVLRFLDAQTYEEKLEIFRSMKKNMDERTLSDISISLDFVLNNGSLEEQFESVRNCLETYAKFECNRFR